MRRIHRYQLGFDYVQGGQSYFLYTVSPQKQRCESQLQTMRIIFAGGPMSQAKSDQMADSNTKDGVRFAELWLRNNSKLCTVCTRFE